MLVKYVNVQIATRSVERIYCRKPVITPVMDKEKIKNTSVIPAKRLH